MPPVIVFTVGKPSLPLPVSMCVDIVQAESSVRARETLPPYIYLRIPARYLYQALVRETNIPKTLVNELPPRSPRRSLPVKIIVNLQLSPPKEVIRSDIGE
jgi:hypothetical protein